MAFKISLWWKDLITKLILIFAFFNVFKNMYLVYFCFAEFDSNKNPLIPDYIANYMAFPHYFLIPLWALGVWFYYTSLTTKKYFEREFWVIPTGLFVLWGLEVIVFRFSQFINPFG
ncbi:MAG: hypothetical protein AAF489_14650 [Bacteroidota bacterium]